MVFSSNIRFKFDNFSVYRLGKVGGPSKYVLYEFELEKQNQELNGSIGM